MSILGSIYKSFSGLVGFTKALDNLSNNVANVNTPGYKGRDLFFKELAGDGNNGEGVSVSADASVRFAEGEIRDTGTDTDLAIEGNGFFIVRDTQTHEERYTRAGQFRFDEDGFLVDPATDRRVAATDGKNLQDINIEQFSVSPFIPSTRVELSGNLNLSSQVGDTFPAEPDAESFDVDIIDGQGQTRTLSLLFTLTEQEIESENSEDTDAAAGDSEDGTDDSETVVETEQVWVLTVTDENDDVVVEDTVIRFGTDGSILAGSESVTFSYSVAEDVATELTLDFGEPGSFAGLTNFSSADSSVELGEVDGRSTGDLTTVTFDEDGVLNGEYSNGHSVELQQLALAHFGDLSDLIAVNDTLFKLAPGGVREIGLAGEGVFGTISPGSLELSNVELSREFADIIIVQRGYQASSQVLNVSNEMIEELYNSVQGR